MQLSLDQIIGYLHLLLFIFVIVNMLVSIAINRIIKLPISKTVLTYWISVVGIFFLGALFHSIEIMSHLILTLTIIPLYLLIKILFDLLDYSFPNKYVFAIHFVAGGSCTILLYLNGASPSITAIPTVLGGIIYLIFGGIIAFKKRKEHNRVLLLILGIFLFFGAFVQSTYPLSLINPTMSIAGWILAFFGYQFGSPILIALILEDVYRKEKFKLVKTMNAYERFVPKKLLHLLQKYDITSVELGDNRTEEMAILFAKINTFSTATLALSPKETLNLLNLFYSTIEPIIHKHEGFINNYHDGALTAIFPSSTENSITAAIEMKSKVKQLNHNLNLDGFNSIDIGIGIDSGKSIIGTTGSKHRMKGTVISTSINMAQELAKLSERYQSTILITGHTLITTEKSENHQFEFVDNKYLQGRNTPVTLYEITGDITAS